MPPLGEAFERQSATHSTFLNPRRPGPTGRLPGLPLRARQRRRVRHRHPRGRGRHDDRPSERCGLPRRAQANGSKADDGGTGPHHCNPQRHPLGDDLELGTGTHQPLGRPLRRRMLAHWRASGSAFHLPPPGDTRCRPLWPRFQLRRSTWSRRSRAWIDASRRRRHSAGTLRIIRSSSTCVRQIVTRRWKRGLICSLSGGAWPTDHAPPCFCALPVAWPARHHAYRLQRKRTPASSRSGSVMRWTQCRWHRH